MKWDFYVGLCLSKYLCLCVSMHMCVRKTCEGGKKDYERQENVWGGGDRIERDTKREYDLSKLR